MVEAIGFAGLKAELSELNMKCQLARDNEVRFALQRGRLEAERATLLAKMIEAVEARQTTPTVILPPLPTKSTAALALPEDDDEEPVAETRHKHKPDGLPTYQRMVQTVLDNAAPRWLAPRQMTAIIQQTWWSDIPANKAASVAWGMARTGMIDKRGSRYRAKLNGHAREATTPSGNGAVRNPSR